MTAAAAAAPLDDDEDEYEDNDDDDAFASNCGLRLCSETAVSNHAQG